MKKIIYTLIMSVAVCLTTVSCNVLDQYPHNGVSRDNLTEEDLAFIGRFATTAASLSTELLGGIPSIQPEAVVLERMKEL